MKTLIKLLLFVASFSASLVLPVVAQTSQPQQTMLQKVKSMKLEMAGGKVKAYYAAEYKARVGDVRPLVEEAMEFFRKKLNVKEEFSIAILTRDHWTRHIEGIPYGLPFVDDNIAVFPATDDGVITAGAIAMKSNLSTMTLNKIKQSGYDFKRAAMKFTDLIALHELGHVYVSAYGIKPPTKWLSEFLAQYFTHTFLKERHPRLAELFEVMAANVYIEGLKSPQHTTLTDFERFYGSVGADNYAWYQGKFLRKASQIYEANKLRFSADLKTAFPLDEQEAVTPEVALERLEKVNQDLAQWARSLK